MEQLTTTATKWTIDPAHSDIQFKVKHLVISTVTGEFGEFSGGLELEGEELDSGRAFFSAKVDSISTGNADRDAHLKSDDFFNAEKYPEMTFESAKIEKTGEGKYRIHGNLTIRDVTKQVTLDVEHGGTVTDPYGNTKAGYEINGKINRKDFGLKWNAVTEAGSVVVSDEVRLTLSVQVMKEEEDA
jgi:polyisoprenoid-binding protein YceI